MDITPSTEETLHSQLLAQKIHQEIIANNGAIPFSKYMEMTLYAPGLGYYAAGRTKLGQRGDFTTAPEISPLFGATITQSLLPAIDELKAKGQPINILEFGAGSGALAESILNTFNNEGVSIDSYNILDLSADLIERQKNRLAGRAEKIQWLTELPQKFTGVILANEVLDAMPIELVTYIDGAWQYKDVCSNKNSDDSITFTFCPGQKVPEELIPNYLQTANLLNGYTTELHPQSQAWIRALGQCLDQGMFLTFDYGFPEREYYHSQRGQGTLIGHYRHHTIQDPFYFPGLCDLTSHVNWTVIAETAIEHGFNFSGYTSQASYLMDAGIGQLLLNMADPRDIKNFMPLSNGIQKLLSEAEMGELFKVLCLTKKMSISESELPGFRSRPRAL
jgi:SAM-dependent MidA family methyltransferase